MKRLLLFVIIVAIGIASDTTSQSPDTVQIVSKTPMMLGKIHLAPCAQIDTMTYVSLQSDTMKSPSFLPLPAPQVVFALNDSVAYINGETYFSSEWVLNALAEIKKCLRGGK